MNNLCFKTSPALDALFFLKKCSMDDGQWMPLNQAPKDVILDHPLYRLQYDKIAQFKEHFPIQHYDYKYDMSTMGLILSAYTNNALGNLTLDDLADIFNSPHKLYDTVKGRITNGFNTYHVYPLLEELKGSLGNALSKDIAVLSDFGFEELYNTEITPLLHDEIKRYEKIIENLDFSLLYKNISILKYTNQISSATIFFTFFSLPYCLSLYNGAYAACYTRENHIDLFAISAHELMHGFASNEILSLYKEYIESNKYLQSTHYRLLHEFGSGDEEELVKAAEYYLCYLSCNYNKNHLFDIAKSDYDGCCPVSVMIFDLLMKENSIPDNYNKWLKNIFESHILPKENIQDYIEKLL